MKHAALGAFAGAFAVGAAASGAWAITSILGALGVDVPYFETFVVMALWMGSASAAELRSRDREQVA